MMECTQGTTLAGSQIGPIGQQFGNLTTVDTKKRPRLETALFTLFFNLLFKMKKYSLFRPSSACC
ncbi:hypothetical protein NSQ38_15520 [Paenibacillus sp. FSL R7-0313]|uniref:hypothetical protein n=1 Tax=Paenibacillus sp. FSL R7-0313 TaxID=2954532 RepID=UPI0030D89928